MGGWWEECRASLGFSLPAMPGLGQNVCGKWVPSAPPNAASTRNFQISGKSQGREEKEEGVYFQEATTKPWIGAGSPAGYKL